MNMPHSLLLGILALLLSLASSAGAEVLRLDATTRFIDSSGHLERLDDPEGRLDAAGAAGAEGWSPLPGNLNAGFTSSVIWLRLRLDVQSTAANDWILQMSNALVDDARLYARQPGGDWRLLDLSGENVPRRSWPVDYRSPVFHFEPDGIGEHVLLLRLQSKNALASRLHVWQRMAFDDHSRREGLFFGLYFGFYLLLIGFQAVFWILTRAPMSGLFLLYLSGCVTNEVVSLGLVQQITGLPVTWSDRLVGSGIAISTLLGALVTCRQLALGDLYPRLVRRLIYGVTAMVLACVALVLSGHYAWGMIPIQTLALLLILFFSSLGGYLLLRGYRPARFFALAFGVFYLGVLISFLRNLGYLPVNPWTQHASAIGTMMHMVLLSLFVVGRHEHQRRTREYRQVNMAAELVRRHNRRLERQVARRTADLSQEIERRERLEGELRASLELERRVREEQRDFVAMISHEFRTPLAIISTSAQQLSRNLDAPPEKSLKRCSNIREAANRLMKLVDEYLTEDRISETPVEPRLERFDLCALVEQLSQEFLPERVICRHDLGTGTIESDPGLLRIALRNLLANADRHAPPGETVEVELTQQGGMLHILVSNPAEAFSAVERENLFRKYYRGMGAQHSPGAGLGLYLVRRIAEILGGTVTLNGTGGSEPVCFCLSLPIEAVGAGPGIPS